MILQVRRHFPTDQVGRLVAHLRRLPHGRHGSQAITLDFAGSVFDATPILRYTLIFQLPIYLEPGVDRKPDMFLAIGSLFPNR